MAENELTFDGNRVATKRGVPVYRVNPSIPAANGLTTRQKRFEVPGGKGAVIVDNSTGEIKGIGGMGFWWQEEVDASRFVKPFLDGASSKPATFQNRGCKSLNWSITRCGSIRAMTKSN